MTENSTPKTDSKLSIIAAGDGFVCFCPMFCKSKAMVVAKTARYNKPMMEPVVQWVGRSSKKKATIHENTAA